MRGSPVWAEKEDLLASVPGVGSIIARTLIAEMPELGTLDRRQIAALAGLAPWTRQSGQWKGKSFIGGGRKTVRSLLFVGAMVAARHNPAPQEIPRQAGGGRKIQTARPRRRRPKAADDPQRNPAGQKAMARRNRLIAKTVAPRLREVDIRDSEWRAEFAGIVRNVSVSSAPSPTRRLRRHPPASGEGIPRSAEQRDLFHQRQGVEARGGDFARRRRRFGVRPLRVWSALRPPGRRHLQRRRAGRPCRMRRSRAKSFRRSMRPARLSVGPAVAAAAGGARSALCAGGVPLASGLDLDAQCADDPDLLFQFDAELIADAALAHRPDDIAQLSATAAAVSLVGAARGRQGATERFRPAAAAAFRSPVRAGRPHPPCAASRRRAGGARIRAGTSGRAPSP